MGYLKIIIPIIIVIVIGIAIGISSDQETIEEEEIQWITSGPFQIEKNQYYLGEKIFINVNNIPNDVNGEMIFLRPTNTPVPGELELEGISNDLIKTKTKYLGIEFDGEKKGNFNRYFEPKMHPYNGPCSIDGLIGEWVIVFSGTEYESISFKIINETASWDNRTFDPVC
jgi:hypothetical protein